MTTAIAAPEPESKVLTVKAPDLRILEVRIIGDSPYMQHAFTEKAMAQMKAKHEAGSTARGKKERSKRDFEEDAKAATHRSTEGWVGIPASSFRNAMISACRMVGFQMTKAKLSVFVKQDGLDAVDGQGLVKLIAGKPETPILAVRNETGVVDLRCRPLWRVWSAVLRIQYDADQFTATDVANLLMRAGAQVGIGEGRPDSKKSAGMGFGLFHVEAPTS